MFVRTSGRGVRTPYANSYQLIMWPIVQLTDMMYKCQDLTNNGVIDILVQDVAMQNNRIERGPRSCSSLTGIYLYSIYIIQLYIYTVYKSTVSSLMNAHTPLTSDPCSNVKGWLLRYGLPKTTKSIAFPVYYQPKLLHLCTLQKPCIGIKKILSNFLLLISFVTSDLFLG